MANASVEKAHTHLISVQRASERAGARAKERERENGGARERVEREQLNKISIQDGHDNIRGSRGIVCTEQIESSTQLL